LTEGEEKETPTPRKPGKVIAKDVVRIRGATGDRDPPIIVSIPKSVLNAANMRKGDDVRIYTDGRKVYLDRLEEPEI